ncbi:hypothetical protein BT69DRAFT_1223648 [Atractiella rhizophila]|nr:hypothetical protein BT69DRAFT_1223648 [Atractiella rhizophila]
MDSRTEHIDRVVRNWKAQGKFSDPLSGWRDESYTIYAPAKNQKDDEMEDSAAVLGGGEVAFKMERAACALFSFATFGVHLNGWTVDANGTKKLWVPRRTKTKQTWPGYLDNTVAGGITFGETPTAVMIRECAEEASLPPSFVRKYIKPAGLISYIYRTKSGWIQPEQQFIYDLEWPSATSNTHNSFKIPTPTTNPADGEVESFELMDLGTVMQKMFDGEFKPNCALVVVDWLIRKGILSSEGDSKYAQVCRKLRGSLALPSM